METIFHRFNDKHPDVLIISLWRIGTCEACEFEGIEVKKYERSTIGFEISKFVWLCNVCASTRIGTAHLYPALYIEQMTILKTIGYCTNLILKKIKEGE